MKSGGGESRETAVHELRGPVSDGLRATIQLCDPSRGGVRVGLLVQALEQNPSQFGSSIRR